MGKFLIPLYAISLLFVSCNNNNKEQTNNNETINLIFKPDFDSIKMHYTIEAIYDSTKEGTKYSLEMIHKLKKSDDAILIETYFDNISMNATILGNKIDISAGDTNKSTIPQAELIAAPVFAFYHSTVTSKYTNLFEKITENINAINPISGQKETESKMQFIISYPKNSVETGTEWKGSLHTRIGGKQVENAKMKILGIKNGIAEISVEAKINSNGEKFGKEFTIKGNLAGNVFVDVKSGWQNKANLEMHFIVAMDGKKTPMTQKITFESIR